MSFNYKTEKEVTSETIKFCKENILSITDLTRTNKLSEILNKYAVNESDEIYIIQNSKNKNAAAVITDLKHYEKLLKLKEAFDKAIDEEICTAALGRINDKADVSFSEVLKESDFTFDDIIHNLDNVEVDEEN